MIPIPRIADVSICDFLSSSSDSTLRSGPQLYRAIAVREGRTHQHATAFPNNAFDSDASDGPGIVVVDDESEKTVPPFVLEHIFANIVLREEMLGAIYSMWCLASESDQSCLAKMEPTLLNNIHSSMIDSFLSECVCV